MSKTSTYSIQSKSELYQKVKDVYFLSIHIHIGMANQNIQLFFATNGCQYVPDLIVIV